MRIRRSIAFVMTAALLAAGCEATAETGFTVSDAPSVAAEFVLILDPVATSAFSDEELAELVTIISERSLSQVTLEASESGTELRTSLTYSALRSSAPFTGVSDASFEAVGEDAGVLTVVLVEPSALIGAIEDAVSGQPDADALARAMLASTRVSVAVEFPGGASRVVAPPGLTPESAGGIVRIVQPLDRHVSGTLTVAGGLDRPRTFPVLPVLLFAAASAAAVLWVRRP